MLQTVPYGLLEMLCIGWTVFGLQKQCLNSSSRKGSGLKSCGQTSLSHRPRLRTSSAPAFGRRRANPPPWGLGGPVRLNRHLDTVIMRAFDQRLVELQRLSSGEHGEGRLSAIPQTLRICSTSAVCSLKGSTARSVRPYKSGIAEAADGLRPVTLVPLQRLQPVKRTNTARRPLWTPSPWRSGRLP